MCCFHAALSSSLVVEVNEVTGNIPILNFERQQARRTKDLIRYAEELTLDVERFRDELKSERYRERVRADFLAGVQNGVYGTPGLFLNGVRCDGEWAKNRYGAF